MDFVAVYRAQSAPLLLPDDFLRVNFPMKEGTIVLTFRTRQLDKGLSQPLPGHLWIDARGPARNIEDAVSSFGNVAGGVIPVIAFSVNAAVGDMLFHLAYDNSPNLNERVFIQSMIPDEGPAIQMGKKVNINATRNLMRSIEENAERERIVRAIGQYALALKNWIWGYEILATAHLYMGIEALSKAVVRNMQGDQNDEDFAKVVGIDVQSLRPCDRLSTHIEAKIRREKLFKGDVDTYKIARRASDGFEHGFLPFDEVRSLAKEVRDKTAKYLREGIIECLDLDQETRSILLNKPYDKPLGCWPVVKYTRGSLVGEGNRLSNEENQYPILAWRQTIKELELNQEGEYSIKFDASITPLLAEGISFRGESLEVWAP